MVPMCIVKTLAKQAVATFRNSESSSIFQSQLEKLASLTKQLNPSELGLSEEEEQKKEDSLHKNHYRHNHNAPVTFINVYEGNLFTFGIFVIRKGCAIPLHDHPGMIGICKVLYGSMKVISYELGDTREIVLPCGKSRNVLIVTKLPEKIVVSNSPTCEMLTPKHGNYHSLVAIKDVAIFDILAPPYSDDRDCNYYRELPDAEQVELGVNRSDEERTNGITMLEEINAPSDFFCNSKPYKGPSVDIEESL